MCRYLLEGMLDMAVRNELPEEIGAKVEGYLRRQLKSEYLVMLKPLA